MQRTKFCCKNNFSAVRTRLNQVLEVGSTMETAYRILYNNFASKLTRLRDSKDAQEMRTGQELAGQEYENLYSALEIDLKAKVSIIKPYQELFLGT